MSDERKNALTHCFTYSTNSFVPFLKLLLDILSQILFFEAIYAGDSMNERRGELLNRLLDAVKKCCDIFYMRIYLFYGLRVEFWRI